MTNRPTQATAFVSVGHAFVPAEAVDLALDLERRGYRQTLDGNGWYQVEPAAGLSEGDRSRVARWRAHLALIVATAETHAGAQS